MDFQYCDRCGDITKTNHASGNELLCENCATNGAGGSAPPAPSAPPTGLDVLSDPGPTPAPGPEPSANELDFFSNDTLAMRREPPKPKGERAPGSLFLFKKRFCNTSSASVK